MKQKLRTPLRILLFFAILLFLMACAARILTPGSNRDWESYQAAAFYGEEADTIDVFFVGDSVTAEGISPMEIWHEYGITSMVSAGPWFSMCRTYYTLADIFKSQSPRIVFVETDSLFAKDGTSPLENALTTIMERYFPMIRYHDRWKDLTAEDLTQAPDADWCSVTKGYNYSNECTPWPGEEYRTPSDEKASLSLVDLFYLNRIRRLCEKNGATLVLLQMPCAATWRYPVFNAIKEYTDRHGLLSLDLNPAYEEYGLDWSTDTRDGGNHLNYSGARKVSLWLGLWISDHFDLADHRSDPGYLSWNVCYDLYCNIMQ